MTTACCPAHPHMKCKCLLFCEPVTMNFDCKIYLTNIEMYSSVRALQIMWFIHLPHTRGSAAFLQPNNLFFFEAATNAQHLRRRSRNRLQNRSCYAIVAVDLLCFESLEFDSIKRTKWVDIDVCVCSLVLKVLAYWKAFYTAVKVKYVKTYRKNFRVDS